MEYYQTKVRHLKTMPNGAEKYAVEPFVVEATSVIDAEAATMSYLEANAYQDVCVEEVTKPRVSEIVDVDYASTIYRCKAAFIREDEKTGIEKRTNFVMLIKAADLQGALNEFKARMRETVADYVIIQVAETNIVDFILQQR